ncbi:malate dehydrogenase [Malaciobacter marinus]|uniref:Malate dehydrogenase n=1 Tax=Malaciobacter marinus TaxID=505249 RepID=A0A347TLK2_9BACT|nr:malate dehydrogenase [Malaciobacter marinus]AXX87480.1 malate dehydrogenase, NAD-dependent [Malaciobacter marinus]PHO13740.1 malate dehydrogenase [Malaciobacter marinus]PHO14434.1 malate dehydrogenase [Malaciobacter marinus]
MNNKKVGIIGVGNVGATLAFNLASKSLCNEIVLKDLRENIVEAMALDISQSANAANSKTKVGFAHNNENFANCDVIVITAGIPRKPGMSRDDLLLTNAKIMTSVINDINEQNPNAIYIIVSNPLDAMVYTALKASKLDKNKVLGMAGILDSARMSHFIFEELGYGEGEIDASVMGGHGDDMVPLANYSTVEGKPLDKILNEEQIEKIINKTRHGGAQIVKLLETGSAYYAPAYSASLMVEAILSNNKKVYPCAVMLEGEYGYEDIVAGVPVRLGKNGVEEVIELKLDEKQTAEFAKSIDSVKELVDTLDTKFFV